jgi:hypothetical protein
VQLFFCGAAINSMSVRLTGIVAKILLASCVLLAGCSGSGRPALAPVRGTVTYKGKPVAGATVVFLCEGAPRLAVGTTDEGGEYHLTTYEPDDGAMIGQHVVTVKKRNTGTETADTADGATGGALQGEALSKAIAKSMRESSQQAKKAEKAPSLIPAKYAYLKTSDLRKDVVDGENVINIDLTD